MYYYVVNFSINTINFPVICNHELSKANNWHNRITSFCCFSISIYSIYIDAMLLIISQSNLYVTSL